MELIETLRSHVLALPPLAKFAVAIAVIVGVPAGRPAAQASGDGQPAAFWRYPGATRAGLFRRDPADGQFLLGQLLLMFSAGLEVAVDRFRKAQTRSVMFGLLTTIVPLVLGTVFGRAFGYTVIPPIVVGSLMASLTLLGIAIVARIGTISLEPVIVAIGAAVPSDTLSLLVFAVCISIYATLLAGPAVTFAASEGRRSEQFQPSGLVDHRRGCVVPSGEARNSIAGVAPGGTHAGERWISVSNPTPVAWLSTNLGLG